MLLPRLHCITVLLPFSTWICVLWMLSPPNIINKNVKDLPCVELLGCQAWRGEVQLDTKFKLLAPATVSPC